MCKPLVFVWRSAACCRESGWSTTPFPGPFPPEKAPATRLAGARPWERGSEQCKMADDCGVSCRQSHCISRHFGVSTWLKGPKGTIVSIGSKWLRLRPGWTPRSSASSDTSSWVRASSVFGNLPQWSGPSNLVLEQPMVESQGEWISREEFGLWSFVSAQLANFLGDVSSTCCLSSPTSDQRHSRKNLCSFCKP